MSDCLYSVCLFVCLFACHCLTLSTSPVPGHRSVAGCCPAPAVCCCSWWCPLAPIPFTPCAQHCRTRCQCQCSCTVIRHSPPRYRNTPRGPRGNRFMSGVHFMLRNYDPRQSASAMFSETFVRCQSADQIIPADLRPQADASAVRTPLTTSSSPK